MSPDSFFELLTAQCYQVTVVAICVYFVCKIVPKRQPHLSHALWSLVLLKCITPPVWCSPIGIFSYNATLESANTVALIDQVKTQSTNGMKVDFQLHDLDVAKREMDESSSQIFPSESSNPSQSIAHLTDWTEVLIWCYAIGSVTILFTALIRYRLFVARVASERTHDAPYVCELLNRLRQHVGLKKDVQIHITLNNLGPAVYGLRRPTILVPNAIVESGKSGDLELLLTHELIHIRRGDLWWAIVQSVAKSILWFHPLVWLSSRMLVRESEHCCDMETLAISRCSPVDYARSLLSVLEIKSQLRMPGALPGVRPVDITKSRMERIMRYGQGCRANNRWSVLLVLVLGAILILPGMKSTVGQETQALTPPQSGNLSSNMIVTEYDVSKATKALSASGVPQDELELALIADLIATAGTKEFNAITPPQAKAAADKPSQGNPSMNVVGEKLVVRASPSSQERVREVIRQRNQYGYEQISIETRFIEMPPRALDKLNINWNYVDANQSALKIGDDDWAVSRREWEDLINNLDVINATFEGGKEVMPVELLMAEDTPVPYYFVILDRDGQKAFLNEAQSDSRTNVMQSPKTTAFNGSRTILRDATLESFLMFDKKIAITDAGSQTLYAPKVNVVPVGTKYDLFASTEGKSTIELRWERRVYDVLKKQGSAYTQEVNGGLSFQHPEAKCRLQKGSIKLPVDSAVLICDGLNKGRSNSDERVKLQMIVCRLIEPNLIYKSAEDKAPQLAQPPLVRKNPEASRSDLKQAPKPALEPTLIIKSGNRKSDNDYATLIAEIGTSLGERIGIEGEVQYEISPTRVRVYGKSISLEFGDDSFIQGDEAELVMNKFEDRVNLHFKGNVQCKREGTLFSASELRVTNGGWELSGNAIVKEEKLSLEMRGDKLLIDDFLPRTYRAEGNASLRSKKGDFRSQNISVTLSDDGSEVINAVSPSLIDMELKP